VVAIKDSWAEGSCRGNLLGRSSEEPKSGDDISQRD